MDTLLNLVKEDMQVCSVCIMRINFLIETRKVESQMRNVNDRAKERNMSVFPFSDLKTNPCQAFQ